jgi:hypothetical protein
MVDPDFAAIFPFIQLGLDVDDQAVERLIACMDRGSTSLHSFWNLGHASVVSRIQIDMLLRLLLALKDVQHADNIIINSLCLLASQSGSGQLPALFLDLARAILVRQTFSLPQSKLPTWDFNLGVVATACLCGRQGAEAATIIVNNLLAGILDYSVAGYRDFPRLMDSLATSNSIIFLDVFLGRQANHLGEIGRIFDSVFCHDELGLRNNALGLIETEVLLDWCENDPGHRFAALAQAVQLCCSMPNEADQSELSWTPLALELLSKAPSAEDVLQAFWSVFFPQSWTGSRADVIFKRLPLLDALELHYDPSVATWASTKRIELTRIEAELRAEEKRAFSIMTQRFE